MDGIRHRLCAWRISMKKIALIIALLGCGLTGAAFAETDTQIVRSFVLTEGASYPFVEHAAYPLILFYNSRSSFGLSNAAQYDIAATCANMPQGPYWDQHRYNVTCLVRGIERAKSLGHGR